MTNYKNKIHQLHADLENDPEIIIEQFSVGNPISRNELDSLRNWNNALKDFYEECNSILLIWLKLFFILEFYHIKT